MADEETPVGEIELLSPAFRAALLGSVVILDVRLSDGVLAKREAADPAVHGLDAEHGSDLESDGYG